MTLYLSWETVLWVIGAVGTIGGVLLAGLRYGLAGSFATPASVAALAERVEMVEVKFTAVPTHDDIRQLSNRLSEVERAVAVVGAQISGVHDGIKRLEADLRLLLQHHLPPPGAQK